MFRGMRRATRELSREEAVAILEEADHGVLAVNGDNGYPYAVPVNHVHRDGVIYFHGAVAGHKHDAIVKDGRASFCVIARGEVQPQIFSTYYRSAIAFGTVRILVDAEEKQRAMVAIIERFAPQFMEKGLGAIKAAWDKVAAFAMRIEHLTGKGLDG